MIVTRKNASLIPIRNVEQEAASDGCHAMGVQIEFKETTGLDRRGDLAYLRELFKDFETTEGNRIENTPMCRLWVRRNDSMQLTADKVMAILENDHEIDLSQVFRRRARVGLKDAISRQLAKLVASHSELPAFGPYEIASGHIAIGMKDYNGDLHTVAANVVRAVMPILRRLVPGWNWQSESMPAPAGFFRNQQSGAVVLFRWQD